MCVDANDGDDGAWRRLRTRMLRIWKDAKDGVLVEDVDANNWERRE